MLLTSSDTKPRHDASILVYKVRPEKYVRRVYATAINFPCISTLHLVNLYGKQEWPPNSTDLKPIENLCFKLEKEMKSEMKETKNIADL